MGNSREVISRQVAKQSFAEHHLEEALRGAVAEADGDEDLSRRLRAEARLIWHLICIGYNFRKMGRLAYR